MGNSLIEGAVPLGGPGFVAKKNGNFQPGEYKRLSNLEIDRSGMVINRRNVYSVHGQNAGAAVAPLANVQRFLGNMGEYTLLTNGTQQWLVGNSTFAEIWNNLSAGPTTGSSFSRFVGFFRYNNRNHWLVLEFNVGVSIGLAIYRDTSIPVPDVPETYAPGYHTSLTRTVLFTFAAGTSDFYDFQFKNFFLYKERLWIATSVGLYFSAATDPVNFAAPLGGFFKHPGNTINYAFAIKDNVYTLCDDAVYALTYSTDPNLDSTERPLSDTIGGEMGCVHLDTPYFINNLGIFAINGNNVDKVMDSRFDYGKDTYANRIWSFEEYLVVNKYSPINYDNNYSPPARGNLRTNLWTNPESDTVGGTQIATGWSIADSPDKIRTNLVLNPTFGSDPVANSTWFVSTLNTNFQRTTDTARTGTHCGYVSRSTTGGTQDIGAHCFFMNVVAGADYYASIYVQPEIAFDVELRVYWYNGSTELSSQAVTVNCAGDVWTRIGRKVTAPSNATKGYIRVLFKDVGGQSRHYFDDALFEQTSVLRSYFDGSFADDTMKDYSFTGVAHQSSSTVALATTNVNAVATASDGQPGKVLSLSGVVADAAVLEDLYVVGDCYSTFTYTLNPSAAIVTGAPYTFRCDHRAVGAWGNASFDVKVEFLDSGSAVIGSTTVTIDTDYDATSGYQTLTIDNIVPPANTDAFRFTFKLIFIPASGSTTAWTVYMNRFHVERTTTYSGYFNGNTTDTVSVAYNWTGVAFASTSTSSPDTHGYLKNNGSKFEPFLEGNSLGYNTYFINTENGSTHVLDYMDQYVNSAHGGAGFIVDAITNPIKDSSGNYKWVFLTNKKISETAGGLTYNGYIYYISSSEDTQVNDFAIDSGGVLRRRAPKIDLEIDSYVPDGLEYRSKKFRSLLMQGVIPPTGMQIQAAYDNASYTQTTELGDNESVLTQPRRHYAHRVGLNQRGRSLTLRLSNPLWANSLSAEYGNLEMSDLRVMWSPTQRLPITKNIGS